MTTASEALDRRKAILTAIVDDYVASCAPVASGQLVKKHSLGVSSATVRKDMAQLEDEGFIYQPHLSAGRVPSYAGYRYFVGRLLRSTNLTAQESSAIQSRIRTAPPEVEAVLEIARAVLAGFLGNVAFVALPGGRTVRLESVTIIPQGAGSVRLVVELYGAPAQDRLIAGLPDAGSSQIEMYGREITDLLAGKNASEIDALPQPESRFKCELRLVITATMRALDRRPFGNILYIGLAKMIEQPEFREVSLVRRAAKLLESGDILEALGPQAETKAKVTVVIGGDDMEFLCDYSTVMAPYAFDEEVGILGVLGPSRMPYRRTIGAVRQVAETVSSFSAAGAG